MARQASGRQHPGSRRCPRKPSPFWRESDSAPVNSHRRSTHVFARGLATQGLRATFQKTLSLQKSRPRARSRPPVNGHLSRPRKRSPLHRKDNPEFSHPLSRTRSPSLPYPHTFYPECGHLSSCIQSPRSAQSLYWCGICAPVMGFKGFDVDVNSLKGKPRKCIGDSLRELMVT